jgi:hypothetical protein
MNPKLPYSQVLSTSEKKWQRSEGSAPFVAGANANKIGYYCGGWMIA